MDEKNFVLKNDFGLNEPSSEKVWENNNERSEKFFKEYNPYYNNAYKLRKVDINKLVKDNDLENPINLSNHEEVWGLDLGKYRYDPNRDSNKYEMIIGKEMPDGRVLLSDGRHRTVALRNSGYTHLNIPVIKIK